MTDTTTRTATNTPNTTTNETTIDTNVIQLRAPEPAVPPLEGMPPKDYHYTGMTADDKFTCKKEGEGSGDGIPLPTVRNVKLALLKLGVSLSFNEFADRMLIEGLPGSEASHEIGDADVFELQHVIKTKFGLSVGKDTFFDMVGLLARWGTFHPVRQYLDEMQGKWDGVSRIGALFVDHCGVEDTPLHREFARLWMIAAVRRIRRPGCKFDEMIILESAQGKGKSSALRALAVRDEWFTDAVPLGADPKIMIEQTRGKWIIEIAELNGMSKRDIEHVKATQSRQEDTARGAYGKFTPTVPRQFVFAATTNSDKYLRDFTGNRRSWPMRVSDNTDPGKLVAAIVANRDQWWGEAAALEAQDASIRLDPKFWGAAATVQTERLEINPFEEVLAKHLDGLIGKIASDDVYTLAGAPTGIQRSKMLMDGVKAAMDVLGWKKDKQRLHGKSVACFLKGDKDPGQLREIDVAWDSETRTFTVTGGSRAIAEFDARVETTCADLAAKGEPRVHTMFDPVSGEYKSQIVMEPRTVN